ncbi:hypothetical protein [Paenarthrobacter sp. NPDC090522]|uniref:hypothetical protein n=1 Tax=Paenarthrobacter sp. NPDC090522 TaxID=3364383 RepID=UPI00382F1CF2
MDIAFCVEDGQPVYATKLGAEAQNHPKEWLDKRRPTFICCGCEQKATFVDAKKRNAHFRIATGWEHDEGCDYDTNPGRRNNGPGNPLPNRAPAQGNKEVRYSKPGPLHQTPNGPGGGGTRRNGGNAAGGPLHDVTNLRALLRNLRNRPDYPPQDLYLDVPARGTGAGAAVRATDYFYKIAEVNQQTPHQGGTRAFWGVITNVTDNGNGGYLWLNCDARGHLLTTRVEPALKDELFQLLGIERWWDLYDAHMIVEGVMGGSQKIRIDVTNLQQLAFLPERKAT